MSNVIKEIHTAQRTIVPRTVIFVFVVVVVQLVQSINGKGRVALPGKGGGGQDLFCGFENYHSLSIREAIVLKKSIS